jgi:hypothetical protein
MYAIYKHDGKWWIRESDGTEHGPFDSRAEAQEYLLKLIDERE